MTEGRTVRIEAPPAVKWISGTLEQAGFETWAVGGAVRDALAGRPSGDWDLTTRAPPTVVRKLFRRTVPIGMDHGTVGVLARDGTMYEVTTFRRDVETDGRHAVVVFAERLEDDLARRDFTINAVAWHPIRLELRDPFDGAADLRRGLLRTVGDPADRFREDHLRILRALRFAGDFDLRIEESTWEALRTAVELISRLSPERVRDELLKSLSSRAAPRILDLYRISGALEVVLPEVAQSVPDDEAWRRTLAAVNRLPPSDSYLRLSGLLVEVRPFPAPRGGIDPGIVLVLGLLEHLRFSNARTREIADRVAGVRRPPAGIDPPALRRWLARVGAGAWRGTLKLAGARARAQGAEEVRSHLEFVRALRSEMHAHPPLTQGELAFDGKDLKRMGLRPGPHFGRILESLLQAVMEDPRLNEPESLEGLVRELWIGTPTPGSEEGS